MELLAALLGIIIIFVVLLDGFETVVLPRRVIQRVQLTRVYYKLTWKPFSIFANRIHNSGRREGFLSFYGPLSLIALVGLWAAGLVLGFALLQWALGSPIHMSDGSQPTLLVDIYLSGSTFFTLGLGDVVPTTAFGRVITVFEAGLGLSFLALIIGYLPALNGAFSAREVNVSLLDGRAGSPPSAVTLLTRHGQGAHIAAMKEFLSEWERWSAQLLESHLSYPVLGYFRSQHENESWVASLAMILDTCALVMSGSYGEATRQAQLTYAIARHAAVDLSQIFETPPHMPEQDRLPSEDVAIMMALFQRHELNYLTEARSLERLNEYRASYEPYVNALANYLLMPLPSWIAPEDSRDAWQTTAWE